MADADTKKEQYLSAALFLFAEQHRDFSTAAGPTTPDISTR